MKNIFLSFLMIILLSGTQELNAQKNYAINPIDMSCWAPLNSGVSNCMSILTNNSANPADTLFWWEFLDMSQPSAWTLGFCALPICYAVPAQTKDTFIVKSNGGTIQFVCSHNFGSYPNYIPGNGFARFLIYRNGLKNLADTLICNGKAAASGVHGKARKFEINVSPNPANKYLIINLSEADIATVTILNLIGKEVVKSGYIPGERIDVSSLPDGVYLLQVTCGDEIFNKKFVVSH
jgi:hypothetical protein